MYTKYHENLSSDSSGHTHTHRDDKISLSLLAKRSKLKSAYVEIAFEETNEKDRPLRLP
jgi:hypothetical protein